MAIFLHNHSKRKYYSYSFLILSMEWSLLNCTADWRRFEKVCTANVFSPFGHKRYMARIINFIGGILFSKNVSAIKRAPGRLNCALTLNVFNLFRLMIQWHRGSWKNIGWMRIWRTTGNPYDSFYKSTPLRETVIFKHRSNLTTCFFFYS